MSGLIEFLGAGQSPNHRECLVRIVRGRDDKEELRSNGRRPRPAGPPGTGRDRMRPSRREHDDPNSRSVMASATRRDMLCLAALSAMAADMKPVGAAPDGRITIGSHVSLAPIWFDPAETLGIITPFLLMYAMHDAIAKAMPGNLT